MKKMMKAVAALMLMMTVVFAAGCTKTDDPTNGGDNNEVNLNGTGTYSGHDYVDLGLPSGTLWATCNVGATTPEGYGSYFAWGETETKTNYDWNTYKWSKGNYDQLTKYCCDTVLGYHHFTDNLTLLQTEDDAATANWGNGWCMPTDEQLQELIQSTTHVYKRLNGKGGRLFTAPNGHSLFLPFAGMHEDDNLFGKDGDGYYWSQSLDTRWSERAWMLYMGNPIVQGIQRHCGRSVRAVRSNQ